MRVLVWNIQFFTLKRIRASRGKTPAETLLNQQRADAALNFILTNVVDADPDVFVVLEVKSDWAEELGELAAEGNGPQGLMYLLEQLRRLDGDWYLVPPLKLNPGVLDGQTYTEAVGVFWRNDLVKFRGPHVWPAKPDGTPSETGPSIAPGSGPAAATYPGDWADAMPDAPDASWAAHVALIPGDNPKPTIGDTPTNRQPYITHFQEKDRVIRLFSMHLPPNRTASEALVKLFDLDPKLWTPAANEVSVIAGDMNINLRNSSALQNAGINLVQGEGFALMAPYPISPAWDGTRWKTDAVSMLNRNDPDVNSYMEPSLYDYGFVRYGTPPRARRRYESLMVDRVAGTRRVAGLEEPLRLFDSAMATSLSDLQDEESEKERKELFWDLENFGQMMATSDHAALLIEV